MTRFRALVAEFAPTGKRNLYNAIVYSGVPAGGVLAALVAMLASDAIGWRGGWAVIGSASRKSVATRFRR